MEKVLKKNNILKGAGVLLIAAVMILSTVSVTANTDETLAQIAAKSGPACIQKASSNFAPISMLDTILEEGFEDGIMPPPGGWYTDELNQVTPWGIVDAVTYPDYVHTGAYAGWINYDTPNPSDNWLISPDLDLRGYDSVTLVFWAEGDTNWPTATMELHIRGDGFDDTIWDMIQDEVWSDFIYREMTFDLSNYIGQTINISWRYVGIDGQSFGLDDIIVFSGTPAVPNLDCDGELTWTDVEPGETVTGSFTVENIGEPESMLNWEVESYPTDWGNWTFTPSSGSGLTPEDDPVTVSVSVVAPDEEETEFTGEVKVVNSDDPDDFCIIDVSLATPVNQEPTGLFDWVFLRGLVFNPREDGSRINARAINLHYIEITPQGLRRGVVRLKTVSFRNGVFIKMSEKGLLGNAVRVSGFCHGGIDIK